MLQSSGTGRSVFRARRQTRRYVCRVAASPSLLLVTGLPGTGKSTVASSAAETLGTSVLSHDWVMSGLGGYPEIQLALDEMEFGHRKVGWSILTAVARGQLVEGRSVVLDGVARQAERDVLKALANWARASFVVVATHCSDLSTHRSRIESRERHIPGWQELTWEDVQRAAADWDWIGGDLNLDAARSWPENEAALRRFLESDLMT